MAIPVQEFCAERAERSLTLPRARGLQAASVLDSHSRESWPAGFRTVKRRERRAPIKLQSGAVSRCARADTHPKLGVELDAVIFILAEFWSLRVGRALSPACIRSAACH